MDEATLIEIERGHQKGFTSVEILDVLASHGVQLSEATLRKYVQLGLLPRSVRVGRKGKHQGSQGVYPVHVLRQILQIKRMMAESYTIEQIQREFLFIRNDVEQLEHEVLKYSTKDPNFGKVARRLYNIFRLTGRYAAAAYLRELFDEPTTILYQVAALVRTIDEAAQPGAAFDRETLLAEADVLIMSAVAALEGRAEADMVRHLLRIRDTLARPDAPDRTQDVHEVSTAALDAVNGYFRARLVAVPGIHRYLEELAASPA